ncbi:MAG TPA: methyltransferase domain-containing protein [Anaerolineae bacterium]|nr:methyltransferase domain-containing protein [Anaerolineae bacterium]
MPFAIWQTGGATEHLGGIYATRRLRQMCPLRPGQLLLDIGCGMGYTACSLAREHGARVVAVDSGARSVAEARGRVARAGLAGQVRVVRADAHDLPCAAGSVDCVIVESVLVFCDAPRVLAEVRRALKPGGFVGANELTLLKPPTPELLRLLAETLSIRTFASDGWRALFAQAGFVDVRAAVSRMRLREQLASHIAVDGLGGYLAAAVRGLADASILSAFINRRMLKAARQYASSVGYGLYAGRKPL